MNWAMRLAEICRGDKSLVDIFGVILYTDLHANIKKVLRDQDYWSSLDELSGNNWAVFCIKPEAGRLDYADSRPGQLGLMIPVWKEPEENMSLLEEFEIDSTRDLPLLLVFTIASRERC